MQQCHGLCVGYNLACFHIFGTHFNIAHILAKILLDIMGGGITALKSYSYIMDHRLLKLVQLAYLEETDR